VPCKKNQHFVQWLRGEGVRTLIRPRRERELLCREVPLNLKFGCWEEKIPWWSLPPLNLRGFGGIVSFPKEEGET